MLLLKGMNTLLVAKGKKVTPDDSSLTSLLLGPTGNLRAPTMKVGKTVMVGFNSEVFEEVLT